MNWNTQRSQGPYWHLVILQAAATLALWQGNEAAACDLDPIDAVGNAEDCTNDSSERTHD